MISLLFCLFLFQQPQPQPPAPPKSPAAAPPAEPPKPALEEAPVTTQHQVTIAGRALKYSVTAGRLPLKKDTGEVEANIFFVAYTAERAPNAPQRPLMFSFNGGPGSASVWLHLGAVGPKRVELLPDGRDPAPPYRLIDNEYSWLADTDLVFIDPVGTGYSRAAKPEDAKRYFGLKGDIESIGTFIRNYLSKYERWTSPLFLVGESYGTTRAAGLSGYLIDHGVAFNGIVLISSVLNFQTIEFSKGNDLPYILYVPSYAATAWYHKKLAPELQKDLKKTLAEAESWAFGPYAQALAKGDKLTEAEHRETIAKLARLTGIDPAYIDRAGLRLEIMHFCKELLRDRKQTAGRLDSRFLGTDADGTGDTPDFDPSLAALRPPYTATFNQYIRTGLNYKSDLEYHILGTGITAPWDWGSAGDGFPDTSEALRAAFAKNPYMKVFIASGHYDLATPYFATDYTVSHMGLTPTQRKRIEMKDYEAGHMMYIHTESLAQLQKDVSTFLKSAITH